MKGVVIAQLGARQQYELATMAQREGRLARLITDIWNPLGPRSLQIAEWMKSASVFKVAARRADGIPWSKVVSLNSVALGAYWRRRTQMNRTALHLDFIAEGSRFATRANDYLGIEHDVFVSFSSAGLESILYEKSQGRRTVLDQIDTARIEAAIVAEEERRFPALTPDTAPIPEEYFNRLAMEWSESECVVVNSAWSRQALIQQGVKLEKIAVIPISYRTSSRRSQAKRQASTLKVLWVGRMSLTKGFPYALEAARLLQGKPVSFTFVGSLAVKADGVRLPTNAQWVGPVPHAQASSFYSTHDVFLFPTLSDGFGRTQLEAMAQGLPVIATAHCGDVVEHGVSGFIVEVRDAKGIADAITALLDEPTRLPVMSAAAYSRLADFTPAKTWLQWQRVLWPE